MGIKRITDGSLLIQKKYSGIAQTRINFCDKAKSTLYLIRKENEKITKEILK